MFARSIAFAAIALASALAPAPVARAGEFLGGFNQAWIKDDFGHQWLDGVYDRVESERMIQLTKDAGGKVLRMWILEGKTNEALEWSDAGLTVGIRSDALKNLRDFSLIAKKHGIRIEWTIFTGDPWDWHELNNSAWDEIRRRWYNIFHDLFGSGQAMRENVLRPIIATLTDPEVIDTVFAIDLMNEMDARVIKFGFFDGWKAANRFACSLRQSLKEMIAQRTSKDIPITASVGWPGVPLLNPGAIANVLDGNLDLDCVDFVEIHLYNDEGKIERCDELKKLSEKKTVILGEFGQFSPAYDDALQLKVTENFVRGAKECGMSGAWGWRLSDIRPGHNPEARYSYEAFGKPRPAYDFIRSLFLAM